MVSISLITIFKKTLEISRKLLLTHYARNGRKMVQTTMNGRFLSHRIVIEQTNAELKVVDRVKHVQTLGKTLGEDHAKWRVEIPIGQQLHAFKISNECA